MMIFMKNTCHSNAFIADAIPRLQSTIPNSNRRSNMLPSSHSSATAPYGRYLVNLFEHIMSNIHYMDHCYHITREPKW